MEAASDATLLQFLLPDLALYIALPLAAAAGLIGGAR
jgi:protein-S-isoprenylcysteine O-methyltransferase Ste14